GGDLDPLLRGTELGHSLSPIIVGRDRDKFKTHLRGKDPIDNAVLQPKPRRAVALPFCWCMSYWVIAGWSMTQRHDPSDCRRATSAVIVPFGKRVDVRASSPLNIAGRCS